ncbi:MAG TPA: hypothetical protein VEI06_16875 [Gemmatimonadaceae bacterium]|nr:hypothetical protein [Gemmatimonadaceae bacterium]
MAAALPSARDTDAVPQIQLGKDYRSEGKALTISLVSTFGPQVVAVALGTYGYGSSYGGSVSTAQVGAFFALAGAVVGPAAGYWYAGSPDWKVGLAVRGGLLAAITAVDATTKCNFFSNDCDALYAANLVGSLAILTSEIIDLAKVKGATRRANERRASRLSVTPLVLPGKSTRFGASASVAF